MNTAIYLAAVLASATQSPFDSGPPRPGEIFVNRSDVGERVPDKITPPQFNANGYRVVRGWTEEATGHWGLKQLSYQETVRGESCCFSIFSKGRRLLFAILRPLSHRPNGEIDRQIVERTHLFTLAPFEGWVAACSDGKRDYDLAIVNKRTRRARVINVVDWKLRITNVTLAEPAAFDGSECSELKALN